MKAAVKVIFAGFLLIALAPSLPAQRRAMRDPNSLEDVPTSILDVPDPFRFPAPPALTMRMPLPAKPVSVNELLIPPKAAKEMERSQKAFQSGDVRTSAEHLEKAVQIYPNFLLAHNLLGTRYVRLGEYEKALSEYQKAERLDPQLAQTHENLTVALLFLNRFPEAESAARRALELDPDLVSARYSLARALLGERHVTQEAIDQLRQSESQFPNASLILAQIHFRQNDTAGTITELHRYLQAPPDADNKRKAECWLAQLTHATAEPSCPASITIPSFQ